MVGCPWFVFIGAYRAQDKSQQSPSTDPIDRPLEGYIRTEIKMAVVIITITINISHIIKADPDTRGSPWSLFICGCYDDADEADGLRAGGTNHPIDLR